MRLASTLQGPFAGHTIQPRNIQPLHLYSADRNFRVFIHGGDYVANGSDAAMGWMYKQMKDRYECKLHMLAPDMDDNSQVMVLNRANAWHNRSKESFLTCEADPRHA